MFKKIIFVILFTILFALPTVAAEKMKFSLSIGGLLSSVSQGYDFDFSYDIRSESAKWKESVANVGSAFGFDIGVGIYPIPELEFYTSYNSYGGTSLGDYSLTIPHIYWLDEMISDDIGDVENEFKASIVNFGFAFHPTMSGKIKPYFGAGLSSVTVKVDLVDSVSLDDFLDVMYWEDLYDWWMIFDETIDITKVGFTEESETVWGFHAKAGINIEVGKSICIFAEGRHLSATAKFDRPDGTFKAKMTLDYYEYYYGYEYEYTETLMDIEEIDVDDEIEIKVGGVQGIIGIKFIF